MRTDRERLPGDGNSRPGTAAGGYNARQRQTNAAEQETPHENVSENRRLGFAVEPAGRGSFRMRPQFHGKITLAGGSLAGAWSASSVSSSS